MQETKCKKCEKKSGTPNYQKWSLILGGYIFVTSVYGTVELVKKIIALFQ
jgi:hypothetical protein